MPPFSHAQDKVHKEEANSIYARPAGVVCGAAKWPAYRVPWVCNKIFDLNGGHVTFANELHPLYVGAGRSNYGWK